MNSEISIMGIISCVVHQMVPRKCSIKHIEVVRSIDILFKSKRSVICLTFIFNTNLHLKLHHQSTSYYALKNVMVM